MKKSILLMAVFAATFFQGTSQDLTLPSPKTTDFEIEAKPRISLFESEKFASEQTSKRTASQTPLPIQPEMLLELLSLEKESMRLKTASATNETERLDSIVTSKKPIHPFSPKFERKRHFKYDSEGNLSQEIVSFYNASSSKWQLEKRANFSYDAAGNVTMENWQSWNFSTQNWDLIFEEGFGYDLRNKPIYYYQRQSNFGYRFDYKYDTNGKVATFKSFNWSFSNSNWEKSSRTYFTNFGKSKIALYQVWDEVAQDWVNNSRNSELRDSIGKPIQFFYQIWEPQSHTWKNDDKRVFSYDSDGNNLREVHYAWNQQQNKWVFLDKYESAFDANHNRTRKTIFYWNIIDSVWEPTTKFEYKYNGSDEVVEYTIFLWDANNEQWQNQTLNYFAYDIGGNQVFNELFYWDAKSGQWLGWEKVVQVFSATGQLLESDSYAWDFMKAEWTGAFSFTWAYDVFGNEIHQGQRTWNTLSGNWLNSHQTYVQYDMQVTRQDLILPQSVLGSHKKLEITDHHFDFANYQWVDDKRQDFYYSKSQTVGFDKHSEVEAAVEIFPNPASKYLDIQLKKTLTETAQLSLTNLKGQQIISRELSNKETRLSVAELPRGIYIYQIFQDGGTTSGKVILK